MNGQRAGAAAIEPPPAPAVQASRAPPRRSAGLLQRLAYPVLCKVLAHPGLLRWFSSVVRRSGLLRGFFVARHADVVAILSHDEDFGVLTGGSILTGPFVLGMQHSPQYERDLGIMCNAVHCGPPQFDRDLGIARAAVRRDDLPRIAELVGARARSLLDGLRRPRLDLVRDFGARVPLTLLQEYFGINAPGVAGDDDVIAALRALDSLIVAGTLAPDSLRRRAEQAAETIRRVVGAARLAPPRKDTVLDRMIAPGLGLDRDTIERLLRGFIWVSHGAIPQAITLAIDQLLQRPAAWRALCQAAGAGDRERVTRYLFEALRFSPPFPLMMRACFRDVALRGARRAPLRLPAGRQVGLMTIGAMSDPAAFPRPWEFSIDRPRDAYLIFGAGRYECFGRHIAATELTEMAIALASLPGLRRAAGGAGRIRRDGPAVSSMGLEFDR